MKRFKLWESDITFTICRGTSTLVIKENSHVVVDKVDVLGISALIVTLFVFKCGGRISIPSSARKTIQTLRRSSEITVKMRYEQIFSNCKEIVENHSEDEI